MKYIIITSLLAIITQSSFAQSNEKQRGNESAPNRIDYKNAQDYSQAKENWASSNQAFTSNNAIELEAIILEGEAAEKEFVHPNNEPSKVIGREEKKGVNPDIEMPTPE